MADVVIGAAGEWIRREIGGVAEGYNDQVVLPQGDTVILKADGERIWFTVVNLGQTPVFIHFGFIANRFSGIQLSPNGGSYSCNIRDDFIIPAQQIRALSGTADVPLYLAYVRRYQLISRTGG